MTPRRTITDVLPGTRPDAPRRNALVVFAYALSILVASGLLGYLVGSVV
ncbi:hypothetical protein [Halococcus agarilyticus]|nr:hypothetical protein [Halococcus agarilyticus]